MKNISLILFLNCSSWIINCAFSQPGQWTWMSGDSTLGSVGNYGVQGVPSPLNEPPALYEAIEWKDLSGNFWLYGGLHNIPNECSALWKYDPSTNEWTWMSGLSGTNDPGNYGTLGVTSPANRPPARAWGSASWVDPNGDFWFFGGLFTGPHNDLWKYSVSTNEWTWMSGSNTSGQAGVYGTLGVPAPANHPGSRTEIAAGWTDNSGNLWLFGGLDWGNVGEFNDVWRYDVATNMWTWMKGSNTTISPAVYGTMGVEAAANTPGGRYVHGRWKDSNGNFWIFGGADGSSDYYNDLWRFNPVTTNWTWMSGSNTPNNPGVYGTRCVTSATNIPGARMENRATWIDQQGNFWLFGGLGNTGLLFNDLWKYCHATNEWTWVSGDPIPNSNGLWGTAGVSTPFTKPSGRDGSIAWIDNNGDLFLFGGYGIPIGNTRNDFWKFEIDPACGGSCSSIPVAIFTAPSDICPGTCTDFINASVNATSFQWLFPGANPPLSTDANPTGICYNTPGNYDVTLIATNSNGTDTLTLLNFITVYPHPAPQSITQSGDTLFALSGATSYQWYYNGNIISGATDSFYVATQSGNYNVVCTDINDCEVEAVIFDVIAEIQFAVGPDSYREQLAIFPNPVIEKFTIHSRWLSGSKVKNGTTAFEISIYNVMGEEVQSQESRSKNQEIVFDVSLLSPGIYILEMTTPETSFRTKFLKQ